jgi:hypothetical protein
VCEAGFPGAVPLGPTTTARSGRLGLAAGSDDFGAVPVAGFALRRARFLRALRDGPTATVECACSAVTGGGKLRAISSFKSLRLGRRSGSADGLSSTVVDELESFEGTFTEGSESRVPSLAFSSGGLKLPTVLAPAELSRSTEDRLVCAEDVSVGDTLGAESDRSPLGG